MFGRVLLQYASRVHIQTLTYKLSNTKDFSRIPMPTVSIIYRNITLRSTVLLVLFLANCGIVREGSQVAKAPTERTPSRAQITQVEQEDLGARVFEIEEKTTSEQSTKASNSPSPQTDIPSEYKTNDYTNPQLINQNLPAGVAFIQTGIASWYGPDFQGRNTANGEVYDMNEMTAAHKSLPFDTQVIVENQTNGKRIQLRINDRGPYAKDRVIDLSRAGAEAIDMIGPGTAPVKIFVLDDGTGNIYPTKPHYTVQLGSYDNRAAAEQKSSKIRSSYVAEVQVNGVTYYRVYFGDFENPVIAIEAMNRLKSQGHDGFIKQINKQY